MEVREAIKILESNGFERTNQVGSHIKYSRGSEIITVVMHSSPKERVHDKTEKKIKKIKKG